MILVTGATGTNGIELIKILASRNVPFRAMVRSPAEAKGLTQMPGADVVAGDFDDPASIERALQGVTRAFLLTNSTERAEEQQCNFVKAAVQTGLQHIVKLSQFAAHQASPVRFLRYHAAVEHAIIESGIAYTFLRPNLYMQGLFAFLPTIKAEGRFYAPAGDVAISIVDVRDNAAVAAAALTQPGHEARIYTLTGPAALTHADMAATLSDATNRTITFVDVTPDAMREALAGMKLPPWQADGLIEDYAHYRRGEAATITSGIQDATGQTPRSFTAFAHDCATNFQY